MKKNRDLDEIAAIEKALQEKYGKEAIINPKSGWNPEKEKKYLEDLKKFYKISSSNDNLVVLDGFNINDRLANHNVTNSKCLVCDKSSTLFDNKDNLCLNKYECCFVCYIQFVEDREERWKTGWRPNK